MYHRGIINNKFVVRTPEAACNESDNFCVGGVFKFELQQPHACPHNKLMLNSVNKLNLTNCETQTNNKIQVYLCLMSKINDDDDDDDEPQKTDNDISINGNN